ncbi:MAG: hypothetical protein RLZZ245_3483, partial [Verrucomicrobiota bacterium]
MKPLQRSHARDVCGFFPLENRDDGLISADVAESSHPPNLGLEPKFSQKIPGTGLEPAQMNPPDPKSGASTNSATPAFG